MLEVVQHQQLRAIAEDFQQCLPVRCSRRWLDAQPPGNGCGDLLRVVDRIQGHKKNPMSEEGCGHERRRQRQPGFPYPAGSGQRQQAAPIARKHLRDQAFLALPADDGRWWCWQEERRWPGAPRGWRATECALAPCIGMQMMRRNEQPPAMPRRDQLAACNGPPDGALVDAAVSSGLVRGQQVLMGHIAFCRRERVGLCLHAQCTIKSRRCEGHHPAGSVGVYALCVP